jgi:hypothetical protein
MGRITLLPAILAFCGSASFGQTPFEGPKLLCASNRTGNAESREANPAQEVLPQGAVARLGMPRFANFGRPFALSYARDGKSLAVGSWDGLVSIWNPQKSELLREWDSQAGSVHAVATSTDGSLVAEAGRAPGIRVWRPADGQLIRTLATPKGEEDRTELLAFSPNNKYLLAAGWVWGNGVKYYEQGRSVRLWELASGKQIYTLDRPRKAGFHVPVFSDDGSQLIVAMYDARQRGSEFKPYIVFVDIQTGREAKRISLPPEPVPIWYPIGKELVVSPSGKWLIRIGNQGVEELVWATRLNSGRKKEILKFETVAYDVCVALAPDDRCLAIGFPGHGLTVVELESGQVRCRFSCRDAEDTCLAFSPDSRWLASGSLDRSVLLWDLTGRMANGKMEPIRLTDAELSRLWKDLGATDGASTRRAIWELVAGADDSVTFLGKQLQPDRPPDAKFIARLLTDLGSESFPTRAKAAPELESLHDAAELWVRKKLSESVTLEVRRRLEQVLEKIDEWWAAHQGMVRAVEVLERIASPETCRVLQKLAANETSPRLADEAKAALRRLQ